MSCNKQPIATLNLQEYKIQEFHKRKYFYYEDVDRNILKLLGISEETWKNLNKNPPTKTALDILQENSSNIIPTFSKSLDDLLGGGVPTKLITELVGQAGTGKTQLSLQLCVSVQLSRQFGGLSGHAVFVDSNLGFTKTRFEEISNGTKRHCEIISKKYGLTTVPHNFLDGVHFLKVGTFLELLALVQPLHQLLKDDNLIKLVVIDSITKPLKQSHLDYYMRTKILYTFLGEIQKLAQDFNFAIVLTNSVTTRFTNQGALIASSLGDSFAHRINNRVKLKKINDSEFEASLEKNTLKPKDSICFRITKSGIRDVE